jgi:hypothetical protein
MSMRAGRVAAGLADAAAQDALRPVQDGGQDGGQDGEPGGQ